MKTSPKPVKKFCVGDIKNVFEPEEDHEFFEESNYHGDRDEIWVVVYNKEGKVLSRWNCRFILGIEYA